MERLPSEMNLGELQNRCWSEIEKFGRKEPNEDRYCLEIFRRALVDRDDRAWGILHQGFSTTIVAWLRQHPHREEACRVQAEADYVTLTFERLWKVTVRNRSLEFRNLGGALKFLRLSLNSAVIDAVREHKSNELPISEISFQEPAAPEEETSWELWESIKSMLTDKREQRLAYLLFYCNLKPGQVILYCPDEFREVQEVFQINRRILDRLMRYPDRLYWLLDGDV